MSKNFHELDQAKRHLRMAEIKLGMGEIKECKAEITAANKLLTQVEKDRNGKYDEKSQSSREG